MTKPANPHINHQNNGERDVSDFIIVDRQLPAKVKEDSSLPENTDFAREVKNVIQSSPWRADLSSKDIPVLDKKAMTEQIIANYLATIFRNLPDIDPTLAKNLLAGVIYTLQSSLLNASTEIKHHYEQNDKFEGYNNPIVKKIIKKHMQSEYSQNGINLQLLLKSLLKLLSSTPIHELFGQQKYAESEPAIIAKNVHTIITRTGNVVACGLFIEGMTAVTYIPIAILIGVPLFFALQILNEYTNEVEHTTKEKSKKEFWKRITKWTTILAAKSIPILLTAISAAAITTPKLHQEYLSGEGERLKRQMVDRSSQLETVSLKNIDSQLQEKREKRDKAQEILLNKSEDNKSVRYHANVTVNGGVKSGELKKGVLQEIKDLEVERSTQQKIRENIEKSYSILGSVGFLLENYREFFGKGNKLSNELSNNYIKLIEKYENLPPGIRFENGIHHMIEALQDHTFNDETLLRVWIAVLFESLSIITLVAVQARADYRRVVTNSDTQSSLGQIVEGSIELLRQLSAVINYNDFILEEDKNSNSSKTNTILSESSQGITTPYRYQPPSYSPLVNSPIFQQVVKEMFHKGQVPAFNQIVLDISKGLIHPIPHVGEKSSLQAANKEISESKEDKVDQIPPKIFVNTPDDGNKQTEDNTTGISEEIIIDSVLPTDQQNIQKETSEIKKEITSIPSNKIIDATLPVTEKDIQEEKSESEYNKSLQASPKNSINTLDHRNEQTEDKISRAFKNTVSPSPQNTVKETNKKVTKEEIAKIQILEPDHSHLINIPGYIINDIEDRILSNTKDFPLVELAASLSIILSEHIPVEDKNKLEMFKELDKYGRKKACIDFIHKIEDLNSDVQDIIDTNGASQDRVDLKNAFKDQLRSASKQYRTGEIYENASTLSLKDLVNKIETQEKSISLNIMRVNLVKDFITKRIEKNTITPCSLSHLVYGLRCGDISVIPSISRRDKKDLKKLGKLQLSSPYEEAIESLLFNLEFVANKYSQNKTGFFNIGWFGRKKLKPFQDELQQAIGEYIQASNTAIQSKAKS
jgi:hypothetical protein